MSIVDVAATSARMTGFHLRQLLRTAFFVQLAVSAPLSFMLLRYLGSLGASAHVSTGLWIDGAAAGMWASTTTAVGIIGYQRFQGTLQYLVFARLAPGQVFGALTAASALLGLVGLPEALIVQLLISGTADTSAQAFLGFALAVLACVVSAGMLASLFILSRRALALEPIVLIPVWLLVGLVIPLGSLPVWLQPIALLHPLTGAVAAAHERTLAAAAPWMLASLVAAAVWVAASLVCMRLAVRRATAEGTLGLA